MNAYELAKELDEYNAGGFPVLIVEQGAEMLRQQANYIAQLEKGLESSIKMNKALVERQKNDNDHS